METIEIKTLIDVTNTKVTRANQGSTFEFDQFKNFTTLMQCIGLRCIITYDENPQVEEVDLKNLGFGTAYKGTQKVWTFKFRPDRQLAFEDNNNPVGLLINDMHEVPVIKNLAETVNIEKAVFFTYESQFKNTLIMARSGTL
jgi:hypothetical protein